MAIILVRIDLVTLSRNTIDSRGGMLMGQTNVSRQSVLQATIRMAVPKLLPVFPGNQESYHEVRMQNGGMVLNALWHYQSRPAISQFQYVT